MTIFRGKLLSRLRSVLERPMRIPIDPSTLPNGWFLTDSYYGPDRREQQRRMLRAERRNMPQATLGFWRARDRRLARDRRGMNPN